MRISSLLVILSILSACGGESSAGSSSRRFIISFIAESDPGVPLGDVSINIGDEEIARTDANGLAQSAVAGIEGQVIAVQHVCPEGFQDAGPPTPIQLQQIRSLSDDGITAVNVRLTCQPANRDVALVVRTEGNHSGLPVLLNGEPVTETDANGFAYIIRQDPPGTRYALALDTSMRERVSSTPSPTYTLDAADAVFTWNASVEVEPEPEPTMRRRRRRPRMTVAPRMIVRVGGNGRRRIRRR